MKTIIYFLLVAGLILGASLFIPNIGIDLNNGFVSALIFSLILTVVNMVLGTILKIVGFPLNIITFGLFSIVVTFAMIYLTDRIYTGIEINGILAYIIIALIPGIVGIFVKPFFK